jgi:hypothetical protein
VGQLHFSHHKEGKLNKNIRGFLAKIKYAKVRILLDVEYNLKKTITEKNCFSGSIELFDTGTQLPNCRLI